MPKKVKLVSELDITTYETHKQRNEALDDHVIGDIAQVGNKYYRRYKTDWRNVCEHNVVPHHCSTCEGSSRCKHGSLKAFCTKDDCQGSAICEHGKQRSQCAKCGGGSCCPHMENKAYCKQCEGSAWCEHGKQRHHCLDCGGSQRCEHGRARNQCKDCNGAIFCIHMKRRSRCKICDGSGFCEHGVQPYNCIKCKGKGICEHDRRRFTCRVCQGPGICSHGKTRSYCRPCNGSRVCEHVINKSLCFECKGSQVCEHHNIRYYCIECKGGGICNHLQKRNSCFECNSSKNCDHVIPDQDCSECTRKRGRVCIYHPTSWCGNFASKKYNNYCAFCFQNLFPDTELCRNIRTKELAMVAFVTEMFPYYEWRKNRRIPDGISQRRPDMYCDFEDFVLLIECDECKHKGYSCEHKRIMQLMQDAKMRPIVIIRLNPDAYVDSNGVRVPSCWTYEKSRLIVNDTNAKEWERRLELLAQTIIDNIKEPPQKEVTVVELFF
jgi:hypothetical protein